MWRCAAYAWSYRTGKTPWDTGVTPPEVVELLDTLTPGRALDLGCGTGTNVAYLAQHGWEADGVDGSARAIAMARVTVGGVPGIRLFEGDVTRLDRQLVLEAYDLVLDIGCFHSIGAHRRDAYARGVAAHTSEGARLFVFAFARRRSLGVTPREMGDRFAPWFEPVGRITGTSPPGAAWYLLRRSTSAV
jgi:cyclopropane fatty-acyl-phospholipid synthase-like methyltransferase